MFSEVLGHDSNDKKFQKLLPKLTQERQSVERIDNALLPSSLQINENKFNDKFNNKNKPFILPTQNVSGTPLFLLPELYTESISNIDDHQDNVLNELNDLTQISDLSYQKGRDFMTSSKDQKVFEYSRNITLDVWERNKSNFMKKASENSQNFMLMSLF